MVPGCPWGHLNPHSFLDHRSYDVPHPGLPGFCCLHREMAVWHYCAIPHPRDRLASTWGLFIIINDALWTHWVCRRRRVLGAEKPAWLLLHSTLFMYYSIHCEPQCHLMVVLAFLLSQV